jgi:hypothetical protein
LQTLDHQGFLDEAMARRYSLLENPFDDTALHVSDNVACVRQVWYRRNGYDELPATAARRLTMERGKAIEREVREAIALALHPDWLCYHDTDDRGVMCGQLLLTAKGQLCAAIGREQDILPGIRDMIGHMDLFAWNVVTRQARVYEIKSMPFLGPAPRTKDVFQAATYELMVETAQPQLDIETYIIDVSAVTGEFRSNKLDRGAHRAEVIARLEERQWNTAPQDELPDPSIPDEMFVERGRKPNKRLVNLLCEKYCGYIMCPENHVGEEAALVDE